MMFNKHIFIILLLILVFVFAFTCVSLAMSTDPQYMVSIDTSTPGAYVNSSLGGYDFESLTSEDNKYVYSFYRTGDQFVNGYLVIIDDGVSNSWSIGYVCENGQSIGLYVPAGFAYGPNFSSWQYYWIKQGGIGGSLYNVGTVEDPVYWRGVGLVGVYRRAENEKPTGLREFTDFQAACDFYSDYTPEPEVVDVYGFSLARGNVAYIDFDHIGVNYYAYITSTFDDWSWQGITGHAYWKDDNRIWFWTNSLPSDEEITEYTSGNAFDWQKYGDTNIWGQTKQGFVEWDENSISPNRYLVIVNPNSKHVDNNQVVYNHAIHLSIAGIPSGDSIHIYQLRQYVGAVEENGTVVGNGLVSQYDPSTQESYTTNITYDAETGVGTGVITNNSTDSVVSEVPSGGSNAPLDTPSISEYVHGLTNTLNKFTNQVLEFLQAPLSHIQNLINEGSNFMHSVAQMFTWLPVPVQGVIASGLVLLIVIGVLKLLL